MDIGEKIREIRERNHLSRDSFAERLNISRTTVYRWEEGKFKPNTSNLISISKEFGVKLDEIIKGD